MNPRLHRAAAACATAVVAASLTGCALITPEPLPTQATGAAASAAPADAPTAIDAPTGSEPADEEDADAAGHILYLTRMTQFTHQQLALAELGRTRAQDPEVRDFATAMTEHRAKTLAELEDALVRLGAAAPEAAAGDDTGWAGLLTSNQQRLVERSTDADFDHYWTTAVAMTDEAALTLSRAQLTRADDEADKAVATHQITMLSDEYEQASHLAGPISKRPPLPAR